MVGDSWHSDKVIWSQNLDEFIKMVGWNLVYTSTLELAHKTPCPLPGIKNSYHFVKLQICGIEP